MPNTTPFDRELILSIRDGSEEVLRSRDRRLESNTILRLDSVAAEQPTVVDFQNRIIHEFDARIIFF